MPKTQQSREYADRRSAPRYSLALPIVTRLAQQAEPVVGISRNISVHGVYFILDQELPPGSGLELSFTLPAELTKGTEVFVRTHGRVVRVDREPKSEHVGVAMAIEKYEIVRAKPSVS